MQTVSSLFVGVRPTVNIDTALIFRQGIDFQALFNKLRSMDYNLLSQGIKHVGGDKQSEIRIDFRDEASKDEFLEEIRK